MPRNTKLLGDLILEVRIVEELSSEVERALDRGDDEDAARMLADARRRLQKAQRWADALGAGEAVAA